MSETTHRLTELLRHFDAAMLITGGGQSVMHGRPMALAEIDADRELWFSTSMLSNKVVELRADPSVLLTFQSGQRFASLNGTCQLTQDRATIDRLWNETWRIWYPEGKDDPNLVLLRVRIEGGEFWDVSGTKGLRFLWNAAKAYFSGEPMEDVRGTHGEI